MSENSSAGPQRSPRRRARHSPIPDAKEVNQHVPEVIRSDPGQSLPAGANDPANREPLSSRAQLIAGKYLLLENLEGSNLRRSIDLVSQKECSCRVVSRQAGASLLEAHFRLDFSEKIAQPFDIVTSSNEQYIFFHKTFGDIHELVRNQGVRDEEHAQILLRQVVGIIADCHSAGVVLTDMKLRRFVFSDPERTKIVLETLENATVLSDVVDIQPFRRVGYPTYLSPEAIICLKGGSYAGRPADIWGLGVIIYTLLIGRYPFNDQNPLALFSKILQGHFCLPEELSAHAKCLIRNLLRKDPMERLTAEDILSHPWFTERVEDTLESNRGDDDDDEGTGDDHVVPSFGYDEA